MFQIPEGNMFTLLFIVLDLRVNPEVSINGNKLSQITMIYSIRLVKLRLPRLEFFNVIEKRRSSE